jgi:hypothetical protein
MGTPHHLAARDLAEQLYGQPDRLHYGAKAVALRVLGTDDEAAVRIIFRWMNELDPGTRPGFLIKIGRHIAAWESAIRRHAELTADQS